MVIRVPLTPEAHAFRKVLALAEPLAPYSRRSKSKKVLEAAIEAKLSEQQFTRVLCLVHARSGHHLEELIAHLSKHNQGSADSSE